MIRRVVRAVIALVAIVLLYAIRYDIAGLLIWRRVYGEETWGEVCTSTAKPLVLALMMYAQDFDDTLPLCTTTAEFQHVTSAYIKLSSAYSCPRTNERYQFNPRLKGVNIKALRAPGSVWMIREPIPHKDQSHFVAFVDGSHKRLKVLPRHPSKP